MFKAIFRKGLKGKITILICMCHLKIDLIQCIICSYEKKSSPAFSSTFAFSGPEVFTINVRPLSVNTSINTAQRCTSCVSFWPTCWEGTRRQGNRRRHKHEGSSWRVSATCRMQNNINSTTFNFITTKTDTRRRQTQSCSKWRKSFKHDRDIKEALGAANNHSFLLSITESCPRLI